MRRVHRALLGSVLAVYGTLNPKLSEQISSTVRSLVDAEQLAVINPNLDDGARLVGWGVAIALLHAASTTGHAMVGKDDFAFHCTYDQEILRLRAALATLSGMMDDGGGVHVAYSHLVTITTFLLLVVIPFGFAADLGYWAILATPTACLLIAGILVLGRGFQFPFSGIVQIDLLALLHEQHSAWDRYTPLLRIRRV